jgi:predicted ATP-grasp superfamily ATP-dependent carboligase
LRSAAGLDTSHPAVVLGMSETGLGVARSLGRKGIRVIGLDCRRDVGHYSRYVQGRLCPDPLAEEPVFVDHLLSLAQAEKAKPVLFITADGFLRVVSRNRSSVEAQFLVNLPNSFLLEGILNKRTQYELARRSRVDVPNTFVPGTAAELEEAASRMVFPVFVKPADVNVWRRIVSPTLKGFQAGDRHELLVVAEKLLGEGIPLVVQEIVPGPDTNHYKFCCYVSRSGEMSLSFTLQKLRQNPIRFGVGSLVESVRDDELQQVGERLFRDLDYRGVGSAEFKRDERDGRLRLIEINPRYWQQNALADRCGLNFPLENYGDVTGQEREPSKGFAPGVKWLNVYMDFDSFLAYRREGAMTVRHWLRELRGPKVLSDLTWGDPVPALYELRFGARLLRAPRYFSRRLRRQ